MKVKRNYLVYTILITLKNIEPKIWRRFKIDSETPLDEFHEAIQIIMGWENYHLHQFSAKNLFYKDLSDSDFIGSRDCDYSGMRICDLLKKEKQAIEYEYDFGDGWVHEILLEKIQNNAILFCPVCLEGKRACPPEDSFGPWGYQDKLDILKNKEDEDYWETLEWMGEDFDPEAFNLDMINENLKNYFYEDTDF